MTDVAAGLANSVIVLTYLAISLTIARGLWTSCQWRTNKLGTATAAIFFTCALGHAAHVATYAAAPLTGQPAHEHLDRPVLGSLGVFWDLVTAGVALWYWSLRSRFPALVRGAAVFENLRLHQAAERRLRLSERRYRGIVETTSEGVVLLDEAGVVEYANAQFAALVGCTPREVRGRAFTDLVLPQYRERLAGGLAGVREHGTQRLEAELSRRGQPGAHGPAQRVYAQIALTARAESDTGPGDEPPAGAPATRGGALAMVADVTERRNAETQLRQAQRLDAVGQLAGGVAHDFNNLLTVIDGYATILLSEVAGPARRDVTAIREAAARASALTRQLLAFARTQQAQPEAVDLDELVVGIEDMLRRLIREDIQITVRAGSQGATVWADRGQLEQVLMNLAVNSRDAMPDGGRLTISTRRGPGPLADGAGELVTIAVSDTGAGIPEDIQPRIFEPFFTTKEPGQGTGLGLSTVYGIVSQAGGQVVVDSAPGRGTEILVHLPTTEAAPRPGGPSPQTDQLAGGYGTILLVEDDAEIRRLSERVLLAAGYDVLTASDGRGALDVAAAAGPLDLLITDVIMPRMNGRQLADWLRATRPELPVLFVSAYPRGLLGAVLPGEPHGAYLEKPYTPSLLTARVSHLLGAARAAAGAGQRPPDDTTGTTDSQPAAARTDATATDAAVRG